MNPADRIESGLRSSAAAPYRLPAAFAACPAAPANSNAVEGQTNQAMMIRAAPSVSTLSEIK
jgi:hypothetical protein